MKKIHCAMAFLYLLVVCSCHESSSEPKLVVTSFLEAIAKKDFVKARTLATAESKTTLDFLETAISFKNAFDQKNQDKPLIRTDSLQFGKAVTGRDSASISVTELHTKELINFTLLKQEGQWKVAFDKNSLFDMMMKKNGDKEKMATGHSNKMLEYMKTLNLDSLKDRMEKGLERMDSLKKNKGEKNPPQR